MTTTDRLVRARKDHYDADDLPTAHRHEDD